jgi:hypothetical protein
MSLDPKAVFKKAAARAAGATGNIASGAGALVASVALWNPLPLVLWGLGSAGWVLFASTSPKFTRRILDDERRAAELAADQERQALMVKIQAVLTYRPFAAWRRAGLLPDYLKVYSHLETVRDRVAELLAACHDDFLAGLGIQKQLTYLLGAYLQFVQARLTVLQMLAEFRPCIDGDQEREEELAAPPAAGSPPGPRAGSGKAMAPASGGRRRHRAGGSPRTLFAQIAGNVPAVEAAPDIPHGQAAPDVCPVELPSVAALLADLDRRIAELRELATREPATAKTREWHIGLLQKQQELLRDCAGRDQQLVAQLTAVPDAFDVIAGRISATQFDPTELAAYTGGVVEQIEENEKLLRDMGPMPPQQPGAAPATGIDPGPASPTTGGGSK